MQPSRRKYVQVTLALGLGILLATLIFFESALADPANAILDLTVSESGVEVGASFVMTVTLTTGDGEPFGDWQVELLYDEAVLDVDAVWANDTIVPAFAAPIINTSAGEVYIADGAFANNTGSTAPYTLAVITFTTQTAGASAFEVRINPTTPENDTHYADVSSFPPTYYIPATINIAQVEVMDYEWTGASDSDWHTAGNWTPTGVPGATHAVAIPGGLSTYPVLASSASVYTLTVASGASVEVPAAYELQAETVVNHGTLVLWEAVPDGTATSFHLYDSGAGVSYYGLELTATGALNATRVEIRGQQECTTADEPGDTVNRCYDITPAQQPTTATARFYYRDTELDGQTPATMQAWHWSTATLTWTVAGTATPGGTAPNHYVDVTGITSFSPFVLKSDTDQPTSVAFQNVQAVGDFAVLGLGGVLAPVAAFVVRRKRR